jgi:HSP20 family protein
MNIVRWEPFRELDDFFRRYSPMARAGQNGNIGADWAPAADISETDKEYLIKAELPDVKKDDVKVTFNDGVITIAGEKKQDRQEKDEVSLRVESFYGMFSRSFALPENVDEAGIRAESKDGVLRVHVPKKMEVEKKQVNITVQ